MNELEKFKERWQEIMCQCEADTPSHKILADCIDELAGCVKGRIEPLINEGKAGRDFVAGVNFANEEFNGKLRKLNEGDKT